MSRRACKKSRGIYSLASGIPSNSQARRVVIATPCLQLSNTLFRSFSESLSKLYPHFQFTLSRPSFLRILTISPQDLFSITRK